MLTNASFRPLSLSTWCLRNTCMLAEQVLEYGVAEADVILCSHSAQCCIG